MLSKRETTRAESHVRYANARRFTDAKLNETARRTRYAVSRAAEVLSDGKFQQLLAEQGVRKIPAVTASQMRCAEGKDWGRSLDDSISLVMMWAFFFPLFENKSLVAYLEVAHPCFVMTMKDAFISVVMDGPFRQKIRADWLLDGPIPGTAV